MERDSIEQNYILITSTNFPAGGAGATYLNLFCRGMKSNGREITVYLLKGFAFGDYTYKGPRRNISDQGIPYTYLGFKQRPRNQFLKLFDEFSSFFRLIILLFSLLRKRKSIRLLLYTSEIQYNIPVYCVAKLFGIKISKFVAEFIDKSEFSNSFFQKLKSYFYIFDLKYLNKLSDSLIVFSYYLRNEYLKMGYDEQKIIVQPNLTDFEFWKPVNTEIKYTFGYSGAPYLKDGLHDLFQAISLLRKRNIEVSLLVIGDSTFGKSLIPSLKVECNRLEISDKVTFTGLVESSMVKRYLAECRFLAITRPSTTQTKAGFPTKLGEYFATERPVITTNFGDMDKYFKDGVDIIMAECGNSESIATKIAWMLQNDKEMESISKKGYETAKQLLEYQNSINRIIKFLNIS